MDVARPSRVPDPFFPPPHEGRRSACDAVVIVGVDPLYEVFKHAYEGGAMNGVRYGCLRWRVFNCAPIRFETRCWQSVLFSSLVVACLLVMTLLGAFEAHGGPQTEKSHLIHRRTDRRTDIPRTKDKDPGPGIVP